MNHRQTILWNLMLCLLCFYLALDSVNDAEFMGVFMAIGLAFLAATIVTFRGVR